MPPRQASGFDRTDLIFLVTCLFLLVAQRLYTYAEPLERDLATYLVIGREMIRGRALYGDLWINTPPGVHAAYAVATALVGPGKPAVFFLNLLASVLTLLALWAAGTLLAGRRAGFWAATGWVLLSPSPDLQANQPNIEVFLNVLQVGSFALLLKWNESRGRIGFLVWGGVLAALATLFKEVAFFYVGILAVWAAFRSGRLERKGMMRGAWYLAPTLMGWFLLAVVLVLTGVGPEFWSSNWTFNRFVGGSLWMNWLYGLRVWEPFMDVLVPVAVGSLLAVFGFLRFKREKGLLWVAYGLAAYLETAGSGYLRPHYWQLWIPPLILGTATCVYWLPKVFPSWGERAAWGLGAALAVGYGVQTAGWYRMSPEEWSIRKYGPQFCYTETLGLQLKGMLRPEETLFQYGEEPGLYLYSGKRPPTGVLFTYPLFGVPFENCLTPLSEGLERRILADLERAKPEMCVAKIYIQEEMWRDLPISRYIRTNYRPLAEGPRRGPFLLMGRTGGRLDREGLLMPLFQANAPKNGP